MTAKPVALALATIAALTVLGAAASAQSAGERGIKRADLDAYAQAEPRRARTRIRVTPRCYYRRESVDFPVPYECEYPGPGYVRQCNAQLVQERRPSGTVIVPVTRCWWERG